MLPLHLSSFGKVSLEQLRLSSRKERHFGKCCAAAALLSLLRQEMNDITDSVNRVDRNLQ